ncbi:MAG: cation:proton antiporter, partial [Candidatus Methylomirabilis sp.]|nr:cation:proton antiporter [Deltaproteobacteria bacterium]
AAGGAPLQGALKAVGAAGVLAVLARWVIPRALDQVARTRDSELFLLAVVFLGLAVAWITSAAGLSLALGAFLAGLILSESEYGYRALGSLLPFRDVFMSFFFVSIGMLLDVRFVMERPLEIGLLAAGVLALKAMVAGHASLILGLPLRTSLMVGVALCQIGEFSFILSGMGLDQGLIGEDIFQTILGVSILTMIASPFLYALGARLADRIDRLPLPERWKIGSLAARPTSTSNALGDHLVIVGFGLNGRNVARVAQAAGIPYVIVEANPDTVRDERAKGTPIQYGDVTQEAVLAHAGVSRARVCVIAISDPVATRRAAALARHLGPQCHLIVRTRFLREIEPLSALGVDEVIPEEFETSVEIFTRVLHQYLAPEEEIEKCVEEIRADGYRMLRSRRPIRKGFGELANLLADVEVRALRVAPGARAEGRTLGELDLRRRHGVTVVAVRRGGAFSTIPGADERLADGDVAILLGAADRMAEAARLFGSD